MGYGVSKIYICGRRFEELKGRLNNPNKQIASKIRQVDIHSREVVKLVLREYNTL